MLISIHPLSKEYQEESDLSQDLQQELHHHTAQGLIHRTLDKAQPNNTEEEKELEEAITMQGLDHHRGLLIQLIYTAPLLMCPTSMKMPSRKN